MKQCPHCAQFILTPREKQVIDFVRSRDVSTSREFASKFGLSISNASNYFSKLAQFGFIWQEAITAKSGGIEYVYYKRKGA